MEAQAVARDQYLARWKRVSIRFELLCYWSVHESTFDNPADDTHVSIYILARLLYGYCILDIIVHSGNLLSYVRLTITITVEIFIFVAVFQSVNQPKRCVLKIHQQPTLGMCCTINNYNYKPSTNYYKPSYKPSTKNNTNCG